MYAQKRQKKWVGIRSPAPSLSLERERLKSDLEPKLTCMRKHVTFRLKTLGVNAGSYSAIQ